MSAAGSYSGVPPLLRHAATTVHGRFLVRPPLDGLVAGDASSPPRGVPWLVGFHGYAQSAEAMVGPFVDLAPSPRWLVASVQALHPFYAGRSDQVVANWMTRQDRDLAIPDNVGYVDVVLDQLEREFGPPGALAFAGFSQGVAMAYRAGLLGRRPCDVIVAAGGDVPPELRDFRHRPWPRVFMATGTGDSFYTPEQLEAEAAIVRRHRPDVRTLAFTGGHEWSAELVTAARGVLAGLEREPGGAPA